MSGQTLTGTRPESAGTQQSTGTAHAVAAAAEKFPRPRADPQDDWPLDVHLPDEKEDDEC
ncbi:MAG TPA: hypothetical protein VEQ60_13760 [Longimicrobium sp.]|nr:hypothetical protein [Longimicrobium sp.]